MKIHDNNQQSTDTDEDVRANGLIFMKQLLILLLLLTGISSCCNKNKLTVDSTDLEQTENNITVVSKQSQSGILNVSEKIQKQEELTSPDYDCICDFLFNNNDESKSEETGYLLFEYLKGNPSNNTAFAFYLNKKSVSFHDKVQKALVQIMCIDIGEENYTFDTFVKDFDMFKNSISAKNAFGECMNKQYSR